MLLLVTKIDLLYYSTFDQVQYCSSSKSFEDSLEDYEVWANRFKELPLYFMTFHGQESFDIVKEVHIFVTSSNIKWFCFVMYMYGSIINGGCGVVPDDIRFSFYHD